MLLGMDASKLDITVCKWLQLKRWGPNEWIEQPETCEVKRRTHTHTYTQRFLPEQVVKQVT